MNRLLIQTSDKPQGAGRTPTLHIRNNPPIASECNNHRSMDDFICSETSPPSLCNMPKRKRWSMQNAWAAAPNMHVIYAFSRLLHTCGDPLTHIRSRIFPRYAQPTESIFWFEISTRSIEKKERCKILIVIGGGCEENSRRNFLSVFGFYFRKPFMSGIFLCLQYIISLI